MQEWVLQPPKGQQLVLTFETFDVEYNAAYCGGCCDYLEISHGDSSQTFCGTDLPASITTTFTMTLKFITNNMVISPERSGFLASVCCDVSVSGKLSVHLFYVIKITINFSF